MSYLMNAVVLDTARFMLLEVSFLRPSPLGGWSNALNTVAFISLARCTFTWVPREKLLFWEETEGGGRGVPWQSKRLGFSCQLKPTHHATCPTAANQQRSMRC